VADIQPVKVITVEYRAQEGICEQCGKIHKASFPERVAGTVSYGDNLQALVTYLTVYQLIPLKRATELVEDLFGIKISQGAIVSSGQEAYEKLEVTESLIKEEVKGSEVVHFDESGMRVEGENYWLHSAGTESCTVYGIHEKRGKEAMDEIGILPEFKGTAIHDHWISYYTYDNCAHGECNGHHLRHLKYPHENLGCAWAEEMACLLLRIKRHVDLSKLFGADHLEQEDIEIYEGMYQKILTNASTDIEKAQKESRRMIKRMTKYEQETLLFMYDFSVPFTNNLAERDIRMPKAKQKISGGFRSKDGANAFARIRGFVSTVKKRGKNVFDGLVAVFRGDAAEFLYPEPKHDMT
jgi:transposase